MALVRFRALPRGPDAPNLITVGDLARCPDATVARARIAATTEYAVGRLDLIQPLGSASIPLDQSAQTRFRPAPLALYNRASAAASRLAWVPPACTAVAPMLTVTGSAPVIDCHRWVAMVRRRSCR